jgi:hypothetical protein
MKTFGTNTYVTPKNAKGKRMMFFTILFCIAFHLPISSVGE